MKHSYVNQPSRISILVLAIGLLGFGISGIKAATVLIDFSTADTTFPGNPAGGNHWTRIGTTTATTLLDASTGSNLTWTTTVSFSSGNANFGGTAINGNGAAAPFDQGFAIIDGIFSNQPTGIATITVANLVPTTTYAFSTYNDREINWTNGVLNTTIGSGGPSNLTVLKDTVNDFNITSDASGQIAFTFSESSFVSGSTVLNALSITGPAAIPEPSTSLMALLGLSIFGFRRKRSQSVS